MKQTHQIANKYKVVRNHNYTISVIDLKGRQLDFRDITGEDLEFLDFLFETEEEVSSQEKVVDFEIQTKVLNLLSLKPLDFNSLPRRIILDLFLILNKEIICNYISKFSWLKVCYGLQNGSFVNIAEMEKVPMTKFSAMIQVHQQAIDALKNE